jgi:GNAT superfamily N-acetyltransferase
MTIESRYMNDGNEYNFGKMRSNELPILLNMAKEVILHNYVSFLGEDTVNSYINSKQCDEEISKNVENCVVIKLVNKCIGFSIILGNKIHLMMIDREYQNKTHGTYLLKHTENILFEKYNTIELQSFAENSIANRFYEKNGWRKVDTINEGGILLNKYKKEK